MTLKESPKKTPFQDEEKAGVPQALEMSGAQENKIIDLLEKNLELAKKNLWFSERIMRWIFWQKVRSWFYLILIVAPLILAAFYLPPILKDLYSQYDTLWNMITGKKINSELNFEINPDQLQKLKNSGILK